MCLAINIVENENMVNCDIGSSDISKRWIFKNKFKRHEIRKIVLFDNA